METHEEVWVSNLVDAEFENLTRRTERLKGTEMDKTARRLSQVVNTETVKFYGLKYYDTSFFQHIPKSVCNQLLNGYLCLSVWAVEPKAGGQVLETVVSALAPI